MNRLKAFLSLYRGDVALITFLASISGHFLSYHTLGLPIFIKSAFISLVLYNFVYTLNSITDLPEDRINNPHRPLPSGKITLFQSWIYLGFLTLVSIIGTVVIFQGKDLFLALLVVFFGLAYSLPPLALKKIPVVSAFITGWGIAHPLFITGKPELFPFSLSFVLFASGVTLLKDLSDIEGDKLAGRKVITDIISLRGIISIHISVTLLSIGIFLFLQEFLVALIPITTLLTVIVKRLRSDDFENTIYKSLIKAVAISALLVLILKILP